MVEPDKRIYELDPPKILDLTDLPSLAELAVGEQDEQQSRLKYAANIIRSARREYNNKLNELVKDEHSEYNAEDLMRLVGTLEAAYNHILASLSSDNDVYCVLKHLSYAIILAGELDDTNLEPLYEAMSVISNGKIEACGACRREEDSLPE